MPRVVELLIVGGGPAGTAVLLAAARTGALAGWGAAGLVVAESGPRLGAGGLGAYAINSDSTAGTFLASIAGHPDPLIAAVATGPAGQAIAALPPDGPIKLALAAALLDALGAALHATTEAAGGQVLTGHRVLGLQREQHLWIARLHQDGHPPITVAARQVVIATGGVQSDEAVAAAPIASGFLGERCGARVMRADALLAHGGVDAFCARVEGVARPRIAVLGGSTSALASARLILDSAAGARMATGSLALLHRRKLRPFYRTQAAAHADGFTDFGPRDICPVSGFVFRLGGLRMDARDLVLGMLKLGGRKPDRRLRLVWPAASERGLRALDDAHVVVAATGYKPRALAVLDSHGAPIAVHEGAMVDGACRVRDARGVPLPGLFGIGLAAGFVPHGALGGEPSFRGQANGLWLWQTDVGDLIVRQICRQAAPGARLAA